MNAKKKKQMRLTHLKNMRLEYHRKENKIVDSTPKKKGKTTVKKGKKISKTPVVENIIEPIKESAAEPVVESVCEDQNNA